MKSILIFSLFVTIILSGKVQAQATKAIEKGALKTMNSKDFMALNLTEDQKIKVLELLIAQNTSLDSLRIATPYSTSPLVILPAQSKRLSIMRSGDLKILTLLNEEQKKSYSAYAKKRIEKESIVVTGPQKVKVDPISGQRTPVR